MARKPVADSPRPEDDHLMQLLGLRIRALRRAQKLTLQQLGQSSDLSHAFLSQLERGLTTASITTLNRIARTLDTTISALLAQPAEEVVDVLREADGIRVPRTDAPNGAVVRSLTRLDWPVEPLEYTGGPSEFEDYFQHPGHELIYVVTGLIELDFEGGRRERLGPTEVISYPGSLPHRWRVLDDSEVRLLLIVSRQ
ncbi:MULTISPECIES: helix-turn-helix domain-containing protein [unclassified Streptomyces]|uniref:helix-turn-helix domain-containing protein n=1 Tax=unclassified Streptomyces TaxID=2593676 RepID=UPI002E18DC30